MTANIFHSSRFRSIVECDVGHASFATSEKQAKLCQLAQKMICHLNTSPLERGEEKELSQFIEKIKRIDQRLAEDGHGSTLKTYIYALETLRDLRTNASPASQAIAAHDCMLYLMFAKDGNVLENPQKLLPELTDF